VTLESGPDDETQKRLLCKTIAYVLDAYPFYREKRISKDSMKVKYNALIARLGDSLSFCAMGDSLKGFISNEFGDPHFGIDLSSSQCPIKRPVRVKPGIRLYKIGDEVQVSAVFDSLYDSIHLGERVTMVDGNDIGKLISDAPRSMRKNDDQQYDVSELLERGRGEIIRLTLVDSANTPGQVTLYAGRLYKVPGNFRSSDFSVEVDSNNCAVIRFPHWDLDLYTRILDHWDEIKKANSIVFDLRGNGGGETISAIRLFSLFIDRPTYYYNTPQPFSSMVVRNDVRHHYPQNRKIVILVDAGTACTSECFAEAMRQLRNVTIAGTSNTYGAVAERYNILFPGGLILYVDCVAQKVLFDGNRSIEGVGIKPTIKIKVNSVYDLQPYKDKALNIAKRYASSNGSDRLAQK
jgi:C-terminal processing protease CtpA/Prc